MKKNGFTLVELAIVTIILGILAISAIPVSTSVLRSARIQDTKQKLNAIENALEAYLIINGRLPCPASLEDATSATLGDEEGSASACLDGAGHLEITAGGIFYGTVPTAELGLSNSAMSDGWGNKISYIIDEQFVTSFSTTADTAATIIINTGSASTNVTNDAVYVLVSHGENQLGAFPLYSGTQLSSTGISTQEGKNRYQTSFTSEFINYYYSEDFDDYVRYKTKMQLIMDIDWQDIGCADDGTYGDANYGEIKDDGGTNCRKCYKYGRWGTVYTCPS
jgi:prepilin-type N-terminal cleavage/methylation domain-containing protein